MGGSRKRDGRNAAYAESGSNAQRALSEGALCRNGSPLCSRRRPEQGAEMDLVLRREGKLWGVECKRVDAPKLTPLDGSAGRLFLIRSTRSLHDSSLLRSNSATYALWPSRLFQEAPARALDATLPRGLKIEIPRRCSRLEASPGESFVFKEEYTRARNLEGEGFWRGAQVYDVGLPAQPCGELAAETELQPVIATEQRQVDVTIDASGTRY